MAFGGGSVYGSALYDAGLYDSAPVAGTPYVELFLNGAWVNVTPYVRVEQGIEITRGKADEQASPSPAQCRLTFDNSTGNFSPRNASGAYYGYIGRNTQLRVSAYDDAGTLNVRFWGDVPEWPVSWDPTGRNVTTSIVAAGLRRQAAMAIPPQSSYVNAMLHDPGITGLVGFWPMEDGAQATTFASAIAGGAASGTMTGVTPAQDSTFLGEGPLPEFGDGASVRFPVQSNLSAAQTVRGFTKITGSGGGFLWRLDTSGAHYFLVEYAPALNQISLAMYNYATGVQEYTSGPVAWNTPSDWQIGCRFSISLFQNGTGIDYGLATYTPGSPSGLTFTGTVTSSTLGGLTAVTLYTDPANGCTAVVGGLSVQATATVPSLFDLDLLTLVAYRGETGAARAARLAANAGVSYALAGSAADTEAMGSQAAGTFLTVFDQCAETDGGLSTEDVTTRALRFRTRVSMYDQNARIQFTYSTANLNALTPVDDDLNLANDVTVQRVDGGAARQVDTTSAVSTSAVGTYAVQYDLSLGADSQCPDQAGWRLALGTVNKPRWPEVGFDMITLSSVDRTSVIAMREGDLITLVSPPAFSGGDAVTYLRVLGWAETFRDNEWQFDLNCVDMGPLQQVFILNDVTYGILNTDRLGM